MREPWRNSPWRPAGTFVKFVGGDIDFAVAWGGNDDPREHLEVGAIYELDYSEVRSWHTKIWLKEYPKLQFNLTGFEEDQS